MIDYSQKEYSETSGYGYDESLAEDLSLELQRDSRRYFADFES
ncbi:MAG: hypothetical protein Q4B92_02095 [Ruminococcus sp.]|nr:hypothetical protein [Ruminococcus sp.]